MYLPLYMYISNYYFQMLSRKYVLLFKINQKVLNKHVIDNRKPFTAQNICNLNKSIPNLNWFSIQSSVGVSIVSSIDII